MKCHLTELGSVNEKHLWRDTRKSHHTLTPCFPLSPTERKMMSTESIRKGGPQSMSGNRERNVGSKTGRWQLKTNGV